MSDLRSRDLRKTIELQKRHFILPHSPERSAPLSAVHSELL